MKTLKIDTGLKVPSKYSYNRTDNDFKPFVQGLVKALELPDDYATYFDIRGTSDFVSVQDKGMYKVEVFRRFKRDANAFIDQDLIDRLKSHIQYKKDRAQEATNKKNTYEYYRGLINDAIEKFDNGEWHLSLRSTDLSIEIHLTEPDHRERYWHTPFGICAITRSGVITEPTFEKLGSSYSTYPISAAQAWIAEKQPLHDKIIAKAKEIKAALPTEFFKTETT